MSCEICGKDGSLLQANHRERGKIMICRDCWSKLYDKNMIVTGSGCSSCGSSCGSCGI